MVLSHVCFVYIYHAGAALSNVFWYVNWWWSFYCINPTPFTMMIVIIIIVMCDTTLIDFCLEPSVLAMLCQMSPSRGVHSPQMHQKTMEVSFHDDDDIDGKHIYIYICMYFGKMNEY